MRAGVRVIGMRLPGLRREGAGLVLVLGGLALALAIQVAEPVGVPLYDGVINVEPYRYLHPVGGQPGNPSSFRKTTPVTEDFSPVVAAATSESPAQAQLIAQRDAFELPPGTTAVEVAIDPIDPPAVPPTGPVLGNAYRFTITDQAGEPLSIKQPCNGCVSLLLRAPENAPPATMLRFASGEWQDVPTSHAGTANLYQTNPGALGIFAIVATGEDPAGPGFDFFAGIDLVLLLAIAGVALIFGAFVTLLYLRARPRPLPAAQLRRETPDGPGRRLPAKRKGSRRPPGGRSGE